MFRLISHDKCPPGEFRYHQEFAGKVRHFGPSPIIRTVAEALSHFRHANNLPRAGVIECIEDIDAQTCQRLGNMPRFCYDSEKSVASTYASAPVAVPCATCGHH